MKTRSKTILALSLFASVCLAGAGAGLLARKTQVHAEEWSSETALQEYYAYGSEFTVPEYTVTAGGQSVKATYSVTLPDGTLTTGKNFVLSVPGKYTLNYFAVLGGKHYSTVRSFEVKNFLYDVKSEKSSCSFGTYTDHGANSEGLLVHLANKDRLTFYSVIDVEELTRDNNIISGFITPELRGSADFNKLIVTLTDVEYPSRYVSVEINRWQNPSTTSGKGSSFVSAGGNGQDMVGYESNNDKMHVNDNVGQGIDLSFTAQGNAGGWGGAVIDQAPDLKKFTVAFDNETKCVYAQSRLVSDLDDMFYYDTLWDGFISDKVIVSVTAGGLSSATANFCITQFMGITQEQLQSNLFPDTQPPRIDVDTEYTAMPDAKVGTAYRIPSAKAFDALSGVCSVETLVYYAYTSENKISVSCENGTFVPDREGFYSIVYRAEDAFSNVAETVCHVRARTNVPAISAEEPAGAVKACTLGEHVAVQAPVLGGGSGKLDCVITITDPDGNTQTVTDGFDPEIAGEYTVTYAVTDYLGQTGGCSYHVTATVGALALITDTVVLPPIYVSDSSYVLPVRYANDYSSGRLTRTLCHVTVTDANGSRNYKSGSAFTPHVENNGDEVEIMYYCGDVTDTPVRIPVIIGRNGNTVYMTNFLYGNDVTVSASDEQGFEYDTGLAVITENACERSGWTFANAQYAQEFEMKIETLAGYTRFSALEIVLTDSLDPSQHVTVNIALGARTVLTSGSNEAQLNVALGGGKAAEFSFAGGRFRMTADKTTATLIVSSYDNGKKFNGFSSGRVYLSVNTLNNQAGARYMVLSVCGSKLSYMNRDFVAPSIVVLGAYGGKFSINSEYVIHPAVGVDTFAPEVSVTLTALDPKGNPVKDVNGTLLQNVSADDAYTVRLSEYGNYQIKYTIQEINWIGNKKNFTVPITVIDEEAPVIQLTERAPSRVKLGDAVVAPNYTVSDNVTAQENLVVSVYVSNPQGALFALKAGSNSVEAKYTGDYTFIIYVYDEFGNCSSVSYTVTVTE